MVSFEEDKDLKRRSFVSTLSLFFQSGYSATLGLIANLILTILLSPQIFGIYITVLSLIAFLNYFSDIGLAASLIQKKELTKEDAKTTFTVQQLLILTVITIGFFATNFIREFYRLPADGVFLYWALLVGFFFSSLKTIPSVFLEREIKFQKIVFVQVVESTVFYVAVSVLALLGFGLMSFTYSVILRSLVGLVLIYWISPWIPQLGVSKESLKKLLSFGIPFQASSFMALFKDDLIILYLGRAVGFEALGFIGWAKKWADAPIRIISDNIAKVTFPLLSRVQESKDRIRGFSEKILFYQTALIAPVLVGMVVVMRLFVEVIPKYQKWEPALPLFYIFALSSLIVSFPVPFMNLYNALGKVRVTFSYMTFFTILTWILTPLFTTKLGLYGFPLAHLLVSLSYLALLYKAKREVGFKFFPAVYKFLAASLAMGLAVLTVQRYTQISLPFLVILSVLSGAFFYYLFLRGPFNINLFREFKSFYQKK